MIFELFSEGDDTSTFPDVDDLWVRFLYRNSTDEGVSLYEYPMFGLGNSETRIKYQDFVSSIRKFSIDDVPSWCKTCGSVNIFCSTSRQTTSPSSTSDKGKNLDLSPAVAGVVGAVMTIAVVAVGAVSLAVFGGFRVHRTATGPKPASGGFKGAESREPDKDLAIAKNGAKHERIGSWELGGGRPVVDSMKDESVIGATHMRDIDDDGDSLIMGQRPVKPLEGV